MQQFLFYFLPIATLPPKVIHELYNHPLTEKGLNAFLDDWKKTGQSIYFLGLPRKEDSNDPISKFQFPKKQILVFGVLMMFNFATIGIIIDWSSLWLTKDLMAPLFLGGLVIVFFNSGEIVARLDNLSNYLYRNKHILLLLFLLPPLLWLGIIYLGSLIVFLFHSLLG